METQALGGGQTYLLKLIGIPNLDLDYAQWEVGQSFCSLYSHDMPVTVRLVSLWWSYSPQSCLCLCSLGLFRSNLTSNSIRWFSNSYSIPLDSIGTFLIQSSSGSIFITIESSSLTSLPSFTPLCLVLFNLWLCCLLWNISWDVSRPQQFCLVHVTNHYLILSK